MSKDDILKVWCFYPVRPDFFAKPPYYRLFALRAGRAGAVEHCDCEHARRLEQPMPDRLAQ